MRKLAALFFAWALAFTIAQPPYLNAQYVNPGFNKGGGGGGSITVNSAVLICTTASAATCNGPLTTTSGHKVLVFPMGVKTYSVTSSNETYTQESWSPGSDPNGINYGGFYATAGTTGTDTITCNFGSNSVANACFGMDVTGLSVGDPTDQSAVGTSYQPNASQSTGTIGTISLSHWLSIGLFPYDGHGPGTAVTNCPNIVNDTGNQVGGLCYSVQNATTTNWQISTSTGTAAFGTAIVADLH